jgi:hypothetical protein
VPTRQLAISLLLEQFSLVVEQLHCIVHDFMMPCSLNSGIKLFGQG